MEEVAEREGGEKWRGRKEEKAGGKERRGEGRGGKRGREKERNPIGGKSRGRESGLEGRWRRLEGQGGMGREICVKGCNKYPTTDNNNHNKPPTHEVSTADYIIWAC